MVTSSPLPRLRQLYTGLSGRRENQFTASEVRALLHPQAQAGGRREAVLAVAAVPSAWTDHLRHRDLELLGRVAGQLPSILFWHRAGQSFEEIGRRISYLGGTWRAQLALKVAARCIAEQLNARSGSVSSGVDVAAFTAGTLAPPRKSAGLPPREPRRRSWWDRLVESFELFDSSLKVASAINRASPRRQAAVARAWLEGQDLTSTGRR
jgi:hypothetical protein